MLKPSVFFFGIKMQFCIQEMYKIIKLNQCVCTLILNCKTIKNNQFSIELPIHQNTFRIRAIILLISMTCSLVSVFILRTLIYENKIVLLIFLFTGILDFGIIFYAFYTNERVFKILKYLMVIHNDLEQLTNREFDLSYKNTKIFSNICITSMVILIVFTVIQPFCMSGRPSLMFFAEFPCDIVTSLHVNAITYFIMSLLLTIGDQCCMLNSIMNSKSLIVFNGIERSEHTQKCLQIYRKICCTCKAIIGLYSPLLFFVLIVSFYEILNNVFNMYFEGTFQSVFNENMWFQAVIARILQIFIACRIVQYQVRRISIFIYI